MSRRIEVPPKIKLLEPDSKARHSDGGWKIERGMSESLAHALVTRLTAQSIAHSQQLLSCAAPRAARKRAVAFRLAKQDLRSLVPPGLGVCEVSAGDASGKGKHSAFGVFYFSHHHSAAHIDDQLFLTAAAVDSRRVQSRLHAVARITRHALMRLFYRLKVIDDGPVLEELRAMSLTLCYCIAAAKYLSPQATLLVPSNQGMFVLARDRERISHVAVKTWLSDRRIQANPLLDCAVTRAREEGGIVVGLYRRYPVLSDRRLLSDSELPMTTASAEALNRACYDALGGEHQYPPEWRFDESHEFGDGL